MNIKINKGITLIALVITIIILIILAGVTIATLSGQNGIVTRTSQADFLNQMASLKEELNLYHSEKAIEGLGKYDAKSLMAGKENLSYNTQTRGETGNVKTVLPSLPESLNKQIEIFKGEIIFSSQNAQEIEWAKQAGFEVNPYEVKDGVLESAEENLLLVDEKGNITIPANVTKIGEGAFANVQGLKKVVIPGSVKEIETRAFAYNSTLEELEIQEGVEIIGDSAFINCTNLQKVKLANSIHTVKGSVFRNNTKIQEINIPTSLTLINYRLFSGCKSLSQITLQNIVTINDYAFSECTSLANVNISSKMQTISSNAFSSCSKLKEIQIDEKNPNFVSENGYVLNKEKTQVVFITQSAVQAGVLSIPDTINQLNSIPLTNLSDLKEIVISSTTTQIRNNFFQERIANIKITVDEQNPNYMTKNNAVYNKEGTIIYTYYKNDPEIILPEGVLEIKTQCFRDLNKLTKLQLPDSLQSIGDSFCFGDNKITEIHFGKNVKTITAFDQWSGIQKVTIDSENSYLICEDNVIYNKEKTKLIRALHQTQDIVTVPEGVKEIGKTAFYGSKISQIILPNTLESLDGIGLVGNLEKIEIPSSVKTIANNCFVESAALKEIIIHKPEGSITGSPWGCPYGQRAVKWVE